MTFDNEEIMKIFEAKTHLLRERFRASLYAELKDLIDICIHTLECLVKEEEGNRYEYMLQKS